MAVPKVNFVGFNQDYTCLAVGTSNGFAIFSCRPFLCLCKEDLGNVGLVEMLYNSSLVALVGCDEDEENLTRESPPPVISLNPSIAIKAKSDTMPNASLRKLCTRSVHMWNSCDRKTLKHLDFYSNVSMVKMNFKRLVVLLSSEIRLYDLKTLTFLHLIHRDVERSIGASPICALSSNTARCYLALPCTKTQGMVALIDTISLRCTGSVLAHQNLIQVMNFNQSATLLATASAKGTVIRVWSIPTLERVWCFRRGLSDPTMYSISFSPNSDIITCTGNRTVQIFKSELSGRYAGHSPSIDEVTETRGADSQHNSSIRPSISGKTEYHVEDLHTNIPKRPSSAISSLTSYLPQSCREFLDADRPSALIKMNLPSPCRTVAVAYRNVDGRPPSGEVLVACQSGCAYVYEFDPKSDAGTRLRREFFLCEYFDGPRDVPLSAMGLDIV